MNLSYLHPADFTAMFMQRTYDRVRRYQF